MDEIRNDARFMHLMSQLDSELEGMMSDARDTAEKFRNGELLLSK